MRSVASYYYARSIHLRLAEVHATHRSVAFYTRLYLARRRDPLLATRVPDGSCTIIVV